MDFDPRPRRRRLGQPADSLAQTSALTALENSLFGPTTPDAVVGSPSALATLEQEIDWDSHDPAGVADAPAEPEFTGGRAQTPAEPEPERPGFWRQLGTGFRSGMEGQNVRATGQFMQDVAAMLEDARTPQLEAFGQATGQTLSGPDLPLDAWGRTLEEVGTRRGAPHQPTVPTLRDIDGLADVGEYAGYQIGQGVASSLPSLAAGAAGFAAGGPLGALAGAAGASYVLNEGDISQELEDLGIEDPERRAKAAAGLAIPVAALDALPTGRLVRILMGGRAPQEVAQRGLLAGLKRIGIEGGKQAALEAGTEGTQEAIQVVGTRAIAEKPLTALEALERAVEGAAAGGLTGLVMGGGAQTVSEVRGGRGQPEAESTAAPPPEEGASLPPSPPPPGEPVREPPAPPLPETGPDFRKRPGALDELDQLLDDTPETPDEATGEGVSHETEPDAVAGALEAERPRADPIATMEPRFGEDPLPDQLVIDRDFIQNRANARGGLDLGVATEDVESLVRGALDWGQEVTLHIEGKPRRIVAVDRGLRDEQGQPWGIQPLLQPLPGDHARIEIRRPEEGEVRSLERTPMAEPPSFNSEQFGALGELGTQPNEPPPGPPAAGSALAALEEELEGAEIELPSIPADQSNIPTGPRAKPEPVPPRDVPAKLAALHDRMEQEVPGFRDLTPERQLIIMRQMAETRQVPEGGQAPASAPEPEKKPNLSWTRDPEQAVKNGWTEIPGTKQVMLQQGRAVRVRNLATGEEAIHDEGSEPAERLRPFSSATPFAEPKAQTPARPKKPRKAGSRPAAEIGMGRDEPPAQAPAGLAGAVTGKPFRGRLLRGSGREGSPYNPLGAQVPILGAGRYTTPSREYAEHFGPNVQEEDVALENPLVLENDDQWRELTKSAGWPFPNPFGLSPAKAEQVIRRLRAHLEKEGYDGVIVRADRRGDMAKTLLKVFGDDQLVDFRTTPRPVTPPGPDAAPEAPPRPTSETPGPVPQATGRGPAVKSVAEVMPPVAETPPAHDVESAAALVGPQPEEVPDDRDTADREADPGPVRPGVDRRDLAGPPDDRGEARGAEATAPAGADLSGDRAGPGGGDHVAAPARRPVAEGLPRPDREAPAPPPEGARGGDGQSARDVRRAAGNVAGGNYRLTDADRIGQGSPREKAQANLAAIRLLKEIETAGRSATRDEQAVLAKYVGWGGLPNAFNPKHADYLKELADLLTPEEWKAARASTKNAHYTSPEVIQAVYKALGRMGVTGGKLLEPSMGIGNFLGLTPATWRAQWAGVELDPVTGRLAKLLYPQSGIQVTGFEKARFPDASFDVVVSNIPFGDYKLTDRRYDKLKLSVHNYFFAKALDLVRPGGLIAFVTSRYTLDEQAGAFRHYIRARAELLGAIRLPSQAFEGNASTSVVTDVIFLRRRLEGERPDKSEAEWTSLATMATPSGPVPINRYYADHPDHIVGTVGIRSSQFGPQPTVTAHPQGYLELLRTTFARLLTGVYLPHTIESPATSPAADEAALEAPGEIKEGGFIVQGGTLYQRFAGKLRLAEVPKAAHDRVIRLVQMIGDVRGLIQAERLDRPEADVETRRKKLRERYRAFVKAYGAITKEQHTSYVSKKTGKEVVVTTFPNLKIIEEDPASSFLFALEHEFDPETGKATEGGILSQRTVKPERELERADNPADALPFVLNATGRVELEQIAALTGLSPDAAGQALFQQGLIYDDPADDRWVTADEYLSGDVRAKLVLAREAALREPRYQAHVTALEAVIPADLTPGQIHVATGTPWIPTSDVEAFARSLFGRGRARVTYFAPDSKWTVEVDREMSNSVGSHEEWGTSRITGVKLLELALNSKAPVITDPGPPDGPKRVKNVDETVLAEAKWQEIKDRFAAWVWEDAERADRLVRYFNDHFNNLRLRQFDGSHLTFPGQIKLRRGKPFALHTHQRDAVWRILQGNTLLAHVVGAGKTFTMIAAGMEAKRLGLAKKPMYAVPNHLLGQFSRDFRELYPSANLLVAEASDVGPEGRARFQAKVTGSNWDGIVITHSSFERVPMSLAAQQAFIQEQMAELERLMQEEKEAGERQSATVKDIETAQARLEARLEKLNAEWKKDDLLEFESLGIDMLFVDEADLYKNLWIASRRRGMGLEGSQRAFDLYLKTRYMHQLHPGWGTIFATGTPIANSVGEMFTMQRYLGLQQLEAHGLGHFDAWASTFGEDVTGLEMTPDGSGYRMKTRFARFKNVPELIALFRSFADVKLAEDLDLKTPKLIGGTARAVVSRASAKLLVYVQQLLERGKNLDPRHPELDNWLKIVGDGRHAALDIRFVDTDPAPDPEGKITKLSHEVVDRWEQYREHRGTQLIFSDIGTPKGPTKKELKKKVLDADGLEELEGEGLEVTPRGGIPGFNVYAAIKEALVAQGIPAHEIAFIHDANTEAKKVRLFADVNAGRIRVLIGSTEKMGAGTNAQARLVAEHHLDAPWRPRDVEQREGRILRQGNALYESGVIEGVEILRYTTEASFDAFMWGVLERKAVMIGQITKGDLTVREIEDIDSATVNDYATMKAITSGNPAIVEKATVDAQVLKLDRLRKGHLDAQFRLRQELINLPKKLEYWKESAARARRDRTRLEDTTGDQFRITLMGKTYTKRPAAQEALKTVLGQVLAKHAQLIQARGAPMEPQAIGTFAGFDLFLGTHASSLTRAAMALHGEDPYTSEISSDDTALSMLMRLEALARSIEKAEESREREAALIEGIIADIEANAGTPFERQGDLDRLLKRQAELNAMLTKKDLNAQTYAEEGTDEGDGDEELPRGGGAVYLGSLLGGIQAQLDRAAERQKAIAPFSSAEIEERWQAAKGLEPAGIRQRIDEAIQRIRETARHFPAIDPAAGPLEARTNQILLEIEGAQSWAQAQAIHRVREVVKGLTEPEVDLLTRHFALNDLLKDIEDGLYEGKELPFAFPDRHAVAAELARVKTAVSQNPKVAAAIGRRQSFARALTEALVAADQLPQEVLRDERYYHRQVLEYFNAMAPATQRPGTSAQEARVKRKGFQRARVGGQDFNVRYHEAEFEWVAQAYRILHMVQKLEEVKQLADVTDRLKAEAKALNKAALAEQLNTVEAAAELAPFAQTIGRASGELQKLALAGELDLPGFEHLLRALAESHHEWASQPRRQPGEGPRPPFRFSHPQWFQFLKRLLERGDKGAVQAAVIFKALHQREERIHELLGPKYRTWEHLIPPGYRTWQPVKGNHFFQALGIGERALHQVLAGERPLVEGDLREMLALGPARETWVIPQWLGDTMDGFGKVRSTNHFERAWLKLIAHWKRWQLLNPVRLVRYNFNNLSGDFDASLLAPGIHRHTRQAMADLWAYRKGTASRAVTEEMHRAMQLRVIDQGLTVVEIPDLAEVQAFEHLADPNPFRFMYWVSLYWRKAKGLTLFRENVFRLAAYRYYLANPGAVGIASNQAELRHITEPRQRAAKLSRDLIGDYGNISSGGQWARDRLAPFFSWQEINAKRYVTVMRNLTQEDLTPAQRAGAAAVLTKRTVGFGIKIGARIAKRLLQINAFFIFVAAWNALFFSDEDEELRERGRNLHLILGRYKDGSVRSIRIEGAWADFLEWLHLHDYPADVRDVLQGQRTLGEKVQEMARSPIEKIVGLWEPVSKTLYEVLTKRATYPTPFDTRPIRDRWDHVMNSVSLGWLYRVVTDKPVPPGSSYTQFLLVRTDPGEAAFFGLKQRVAEWQAKHGKERSDPNPTERDNALYYWRKALEWGEEEKADHWLQQYFELGGTRASAQQSIKRQAPLKELSEDDRRAFLRELDPEGREMLRLARIWYGRGLRATSGPSIGRTPQSRAGAK